MSVQEPGDDDLMLDLHRPQLPDTAGRDDGWFDDVIGAFQDVATTVIGDHGVEPALHTAVIRACELFGVDRGSIFLRAPNSRHFQGIAAVTPWGDHTLVRRMRCGTGVDLMSQEIVETRRPVLVHDAIADGRPVRSTMVSLQVKEVLGVPLMLRGDVQGLLFLDLAGRSRGFTADEMHRATRYADLMAGLLPSLHRMQELLGTVGELTARARRAAAAGGFRRELARLTRTGTTPGAIVAAVGACTQRACWLTDGAHRVVAYSGDPTGAERAMRALTCPQSSSRLRELADDQILDLTQEGEVLITPIVVGGVRWGHLTLGAGVCPVTARDRAALLDAAHSISIELRVAASSVDSLAEARQQIARALIDGTIDESTRRRAALHSVCLERPRAVFLIAAREPSAIRHDARDIAEAFDRLHRVASVLATPTADGAVAVLIELAEGAHGVGALLSELVTEALAVADADDNLVAAASGLVPEASLVASAYQESVRVLHCLRQLCPPPRRVLTAAELGFAALLLSTTDRADAKAHARTVLGPLLSGVRRDDELVHTVDAFLGCGRRIRETARALDVHENTVRYRLARITGLTGLDVVTNSEDQVSCQLALLILRLCGDLPAAAAAGVGESVTEGADDGA